MSRIEAVRKRSGGGGSRSKRQEDETVWQRGPDVERLISQLIKKVLGLLFLWPVGHLFQILRHLTDVGRLDRARPGRVILPTLRRLLLPCLPFSKGALLWESRRETKISLADCHSFPASCVSKNVVHVSTQGKACTTPLFALPRVEAGDFFSAGFGKRPTNLKTEPCYEEAPHARSKHPPHAA